MARTSQIKLALVDDVKNAFVAVHWVKHPLPRLERTRTMKPWIYALLGTLVLLPNSGCQPTEKLVSVAGRVTLDGQSLTDAQVIFYPMDGDSQRAFIGYVDDQGNFELAQAGTESEGVPPGKYRVSISTAVQRGEITELSPTPPERVPHKYKNGALTFDVPPDGTKQADFQLES